MHVLQAEPPPPFPPFRAVDLSFADMQQLVQQYRDVLPPRELVALICRLQHLDEGAPAAAAAGDKAALLQELWGLLQPQLQQCKPKHVSQVMLACARLSFSAPGLYSSCLQAVISKRDEAEPRWLATTMGALGIAPAGSIQQQYWVEVKEQLLPVFLRQLGSANPHDISMTLGALARAGIKLDGEQVQQLTNGVVGKLPEADAFAISTLVGVWLKVATS